MSGRTLAQVLLRVFGVMLIVNGVAALGTVVLFFAPREELSAGMMRATAIGGFFNVLVSLVAGIYLLRNGDRLGAWLVSDLDEQPSEEPVTPLVVEGVGVRLLGIYLIIAGVRELVRFAAEMFATNPSEGLSHLNVLTLSRTSGGLVELIAGIILLWKREQIVGALSRSWRVIRSREDESQN
jgi:uncharacterized membrane protein